MKRQRKQQHSAVTHEDVQAALRKFEEKGGLIKRLPDEVTPRNSLVGSRWAVYESLNDMGSSGESANR